MHRNQNSTYDLKYHIVLVTKEKSNFITEEIGDFIVKNVKRLFAEKGEIELIRYNENHLFILTSIKPQYAVSSVINSIKSATSRLVKNNFEFEGQFWDNNYFVCSLGDYSIENARNYINSRGAKC